MTQIDELIGKSTMGYCPGLSIYFAYSHPTASQKNPREVQPLLGCGQPEQASCRSILHGSPDLSPNCDSRLLYYPTFYDGVRLGIFCCCLNQELNGFPFIFKIPVCLLQNVFLS